VDIPILLSPAKEFLRSVLRGLDFVQPDFLQFLQALDDGVLARVEDSVGVLSVLLPETYYGSVVLFHSRKIGNSDSRTGWVVGVEFLERTYHEVKIKENLRGGLDFPGTFDTSARSC
jgi:hypothetical protein